MDLAEWLEALTRNFKHNEPFLGLSKRPNTDTSRFQRDCRVAGIEHETDKGIASWHSLRNCYDDMVARSGADVRTLMGLMRHSDKKLSLETYGSVDEAARRAVVEQLATDLDAVIAGTPEGHPRDDADGAHLVHNQNKNPANLTDRGAREMGDTGLEPSGRTGQERTTADTGTGEAAF